MTASLEVQLWNLAHRARWFSARGARPVRAELGAEVFPGLRPAFLDVAVEDDTARFFVPLSYRHPAGPVDACDDGELLWQALREQAPGFAPRRELPGKLSPRRYTGEQSNTTVFFGREALVKVYRRLEPGRNVEIELHEALAGSGVAADLLGTWCEGDTDLAIFLEALPNPTDGFALACKHAQRGLSFERHARLLGESLAAVHQVLATRLTTDTLDSASLRAGRQERLAQAIAEIPELAAYREAVTRLYEAAPTGLVVAQRIHGDCHLGQALLSETTWRYVDFEGEPLVALQERRATDCPLRDVAGMLRSFAYAGANGGATERWLGQCRDAFLSGYGLSAFSQAQLAAYEADKAIYEARYETKYRPHLLAIPMAHLAALPGA